MSWIRFRGIKQQKQDYDRWIDIGIHFDHGWQTNDFMYAVRLRSDCPPQDVVAGLRDLAARIDKKITEVGEIADPELLQAKEENAHLYERIQCLEDLLETYRRTYGDDINKP